MNNNEELKRILLYIASRSFDSGAVRDRGVIFDGTGVPPKYKEYVNQVARVEGLKPFTDSSGYAEIMGKVNQSKFGPLERNEISTALDLRYIGDQRGDFTVIFPKEGDVLSDRAKSVLEAAVLNDRITAINGIPRSRVQEKLRHGQEDGLLVDLKLGLSAPLRMAMDLSTTDISVPQAHRQSLSKAIRMVVGDELEAHHQISRELGAARRAVLERIQAYANEKLAYGRVANNPYMWTKRMVGMWKDRRELKRLDRQLQLQGKELTNFVKRSLTPKFVEEVDRVSRSILINQGVPPQRVAMILPLTVEKLALTLKREVSQTPVNTLGLTTPSEQRIDGMKKPKL